MSNSKQPKNKSNHAKRIANSAPKSAEEKRVKEEQERKERDKAKKRHEKAANRGKKGMAIFFSFLLIMAFAVPSASMLSTCSNSNDSQANAYTQTIDQYNGLIKDNPSESVNYLNLANEYYDYAAAVLQGTVKSSEGSDDLFNKAIENYETFRGMDAGADSSTIAVVSVNEAMAYYYTGDTANALSILQGQTGLTPDNAVVWARLGLVYANSGDAADATAAYNKAIELDPNDTTGAKSFATQQLSLINGQ